MERINDQAFIDENLVETVIARDGVVCIQYSKPVYTPALLAQIDALCERHGEALNVRFYAHYKDAFDFRTLEQIPHVQNLNTDCLSKVDTSTLDALFSLQSLSKLHFGAHAELPCDFLAHPNFFRLRNLVLGDAAKPNLDLSPLSSFRQLETLGIAGFHKNIETIATLPLLHTLGLACIGKTVSLDFISRMTPLRTLRILLGGRENIHAIRHEGLEHLEIIRVKGFSEFFPHHFPNLRHLQIEDHIQMNSLAFGDENNRLTYLRLNNCKKLSDVTGLRKLASLEELAIRHIAVPLDALLEAGLPASLKVFDFVINSKSNAEHLKVRKKLDSLGYVQYRHMLGAA